MSGCLTNNARPSPCPSPVVSPSGHTDVFVALKARVHDSIDGVWLECAEVVQTFHKASVEHRMDDIVVEYLGTGTCHIEYKGKAIHSQLLCWHQAAQYHGEGQILCHVTT